MSKLDSVEWVLNGTFKNSSYVFDAPRIMPWRFMEFMRYRDKMMSKYFELIGNYVIKYVHKSPEWFIKSRVVTYFINWDGTDVFQFKFKRHFYGFILLMIFVSFINLQIFRRLCCKKVIVIRRKKRVDK